MNTRVSPNLTSTFLRLRPDSSIEQMPFDETFWPSWERHPNGDEIVCLLSGAVTFVFERESGNEEISLGRIGDFVFVPQGVWHMARTRVPTVMLFITAGEGTQGRPAVPTPA